MDSPFSPQRSESAASDKSSTLSEFVRRRYTGDVAVFGGNPATGVRELMTASSNSIAVPQLVDAMRQLTSAIIGKNPVKGSDLSPITMVDNTGHEQGLSSASKLSDQAIHALLSASAIQTGDVERYQALILLARDSLRKKEVSMEMQAMRKKARVKRDGVMLLDQVDEDHAEQLYKSFRSIYGLELKRPESIKRLWLACTHDSVTSGRETNRGLALVGDAVLRTKLFESCVSSNVCVSDANNTWQYTQNNAHLRTVGLQAGVIDLVNVNNQVDPTSQSVISTVVEALFGVFYMDQGSHGVMDLNTKIPVLDFESIHKGA